MFSVNSLFLTVFTWKLSPLQDEPGVKMQVKLSCFNQFTKIILFSFGPVNQKTEILSIETTMYDMILMLLVVGKSIVI